MTSQSMPQSPPRPPGPRGSRLGVLLSALRDPLAFLLDMQKCYGNMVVFPPGKGYLLAEPEGIQHVLQDNHPNYVKGGLYREALRSLMGEGLLNIDGAAWRVQRRLAQPAFLHKQNEVFTEAIVGHIQLLIQRLLRVADADSKVDLHHELAHHSLDIILQLIFGEDLGAKSEELAAAFLTAEHELNLLRALVPVHLPDWIPTPSRLRFRRSLQVLDGFIFDAVAQRRSPLSGRSDLLSMYLHARDDESGQSLSDQLVRDEMITLMSAGHETVSDSITWAFYLLMNHPDVYGRVAAEADTALGDRKPLLADVASLPLTAMVFKEALRLYPPAWGFARTALADDAICGYPIAAGSRVYLCPYLLHRHPEIWERPESFQPQRFSPENSAQRHRFAWFPFGGGPRQCIGAGLAMLEAQITIAMLSQRVHFELLPGQHIRPLARVSLKPNGPVWIRIRARGTPV
jgi:cytochrome P450